MRKKGNAFAPQTSRDGLYHDLNRLAKQFVVMDLGCRLSEKGFNSRVSRYDYDGWGKYSAEHVVIGENKSTPIYTVSSCPNGACPL
jgi:hypothetical protein